MTKRSRALALLLGASLAAGCVATPQGQMHPALAAGMAIGYVAASPVLILRGLAEGIAAAPYFAEADPAALNAALVQGGAPVDLERTYRYAYGTGLDAPGGQVFTSLAPATAQFRAALRGYGIADAESYLLTAVRSADAQGFTLYAVVRRPAGAIRVRDAAGREAVLTPEDEAYYEPHAEDAAGRPLDVVLDWAAVPRSAIRTQQGQAVLLTIAANSVLINRRSDDFWPVEARWRGGAFREITAERRALMDGRIG